jgi:hypothetical protein
MTAGIFFAFRLKRTESHVNSNSIAPYFKIIVLHHWLGFLDEQK